MRVRPFTYAELDVEPRWGITPEQWVDAAILSAGATSVERWYVDVEDSANGRDWTPEQRVAYYLRYFARFLERGIDADIYSGRWYFEGYLANSEAFCISPTGRRRRLWNSAYTGDTAISGLPYGGFTAEDVEVEQFAGSTKSEDTCGVLVDLDYLYQEEDMSLAQDVIDLKNLVAGFGYFGVDPEAPAGTSPSLLTQDAAWRAAVADQSSLFLGLSYTQQTLTALQKVAAGQTLTDEERAEVASLVTKIIVSTRLAVPDQPVPPA